MDNNSKAMFEQTSQKKFNRIVDFHSAKCSSDLGMGRYADFYNESGICVARIDQSLGVFEINVNENKGK